MRRYRLIGFAVLAAPFLSTGCKSDPKYDTTVPVVEEFKVPPHEDRFDTPPEQGYKRKGPKKEFKPPSGGMGGPGASMGRQGQGF